MDERRGSDKNERRKKLNGEEYLERGRREETALSQLDKHVTNT